MCVVRTMFWPSCAAIQIWTCISKYMSLHSWAVPKHSWQWLIQLAAPHFIARQSPVLVKDWEGPTTRTQQYFPMAYPGVRTSIRLPFTRTMPTAFDQQPDLISCHHLSLFLMFYVLSVSLWRDLAGCHNSKSRSLKTVQMPCQGGIVITRVSSQSHRKSCYID